jgi:uncharacterized protein YndB with AHSA1/START domain
MAEYKFITTWHLTAPIEKVWAAIVDSERWPGWWDNVEQVIELEPGDADGIGSRRRNIWRTQLPYKLVFDTQVTRIEPPNLLEVAASGELEGTGLWELTSTDDGTRVRYTWHVHTTKAWMNLLAPIARPFFKWNHDAVMRRGGEGLARFLGARLVTHGL